jgi:hypothetical protein
MYYFWSLFIIAALFTFSFNCITSITTSCYCFLQIAMYSLPVLILLCAQPVLLYSGAQPNHHYPSEEVPTFQRDSVEWIPSYEKPNQRSSLRSSLREHVFGTRSLPLRAAVESIPRHTVSYRYVVQSQLTAELGTERETLLRDVQGAAEPITGDERTKSYPFFNLGDGECGWSTPRPDRFTPWNDPVPTVQEAG